MGITYRVIARVTGEDGPIVLHICETQQEQRRIYQAEVCSFRDGGFAEEVTAIEMDSGGATDTQPVAQDDSNDERTKGQ